MKNRIPFKAALIILPLVPFIAFLSLSIIQFRDSLQTIQIFQNQENNTGYMYIASSMILEMQRERGMTATNVNGGGKDAEVARLRSALDGRIDEAEVYFEKTSFYPRMPDTLTSMREELGQLRERVDNGEADFAEVMEEYSRILNEIFDLNGIAALEKTTGGIGKLMSSMNILQDAQEAAGRFRGYLSAIAAADVAIPEAFYVTLIEEYSAININLLSRGVLLDGESADLRETLKNSAQAAKLENAVRKLSMNYRTGGYGIEQGAFWADASYIVDTVHGIVDMEFEKAIAKNSGLKYSLQSDFIRQIVVLVVVLVAVIIMMILIIAQITKRGGRVTDMLGEMSTGRSDLTAEIPVDAKDEIGQLARNFNIYVASLKQMIIQIQQSASGLSAIGKDLSVQIDETGRAKSYISDNLGKVETNVDNQVAGMDNLSAGIGVFTRAVTELSGAIEEQVTAVAESSASIEEMIANIKTVTKNLDNTTGLINELEAESRQGGELIGRVTDQVSQVSEQSAALQEANELISGIADQTNLLAMNAAIEAAHAGEAGKGFSVVADEIRRLAETSAEQSRMISVNIKSITGAIDTVVESARDSERSFTAIVGKVRDVSQLQEGIRGAMSEQNYGSNEILSALSSLHDNSQKVTDANDRMEGTSRKMNTEIDDVKNATDNLLDSVKAMSASVVQIEAVIDHIAGIVKQNEGFVDSLNEKTNSFILD